MTAPEWRDVSALRAYLNSSNHLVDYHGGEILDRLDEAETPEDPPPDADVIEAAAAWLHSWAGDRVGHPWEQVGPARKATMRARARGVLNILRTGQPGGTE